MAVANRAKAELLAKRLDTTGGRIHVLTAAGIGDFGGVYCKWWSVCKSRDVIFWFPAREQGGRASALAEMYGVKYGMLDGLSTEFVWQYVDEYGSNNGEPAIPASGAVLVVQPNRHWEAGHRLVNWYPDLSWRNPTPPIRATTYGHETGMSPYVVVFVSRHGYMEKGGNLLPGQWARIMREIEANIAPVMVLAAGEDIELANDIFEIFSPTLPPLLNVPTANVLAYVKHSLGLFGAHSGIPMLAAWMGRPVLQGYPRWLAPMPGTWEDEACVHSAHCFLDELPDAVPAFAELVMEARRPQMASAEASRGAAIARIQAEHNGVGRVAEAVPA